MSIKSHEYANETAATNIPKPAQSLSTPTDIKPGAYEKVLGRTDRKSVKHPHTKLKSMYM